MGNDTKEKGHGTRLGWRLRVMMAERGIATATDLGRRLDAAGYSITSSQLSRVVENRPERISLEFLEALLAVLQCEVADLLPKYVAGDADAVTAPVSRKGTTAKETGHGLPAAKPKRKRHQPEKALPELSDDDLLGPNVTPFPLPQKK